MKGILNGKLAGGMEYVDDRCSDIVALYNLRYPRATACLTLGVTGSSPWTRTCSAVGWTREKLLGRSGTLSCLSAPSTSSQRHVQWYQSCTRSLGD